MASQPNIIIINPDQWRGDVLGHRGNTAARTPRLDQFTVEDGVSFTNAFCQNPVCTPSRCSFMTGLYPHVRGHRTMFHMLHLERGEENLLHLLKENGYTVWWGGKNDLIPAQFGYDEHCHVKYHASDADAKRFGYTEIRPGNHGGSHEWRGEKDSDQYYSFYKGKLDTGGEDIYFDGDWANIYAACEFIQNYDEDKPFCLFLALGYPHPPYCVEDPWFSAIDRNNLPPRTPVPTNWDGKPSILRGLHERQNMAGWDESRWDELRAVYYGMCARVDEQIKRVTDALKESNRYDESALFVFADHGDFTGDYGIVEKTQNTFEDCLTNVPLVVKPPKGVDIRPGIRDTLVELVDVPATIFELTGIDPGYTHFGKSLTSQLAGDDDEHRDAVFCEGGRLRGETQAMELDSGISDEWMYWPRLSLQASDEVDYHSKGVMCRTKTMKYLHRLYEHDELYDLVKDPREVENVINNPEYANELAALRERTLRWFVETADVVPFESDKRN